MKADLSWIKNSKLFVNILTVLAVVGSLYFIIETARFGKGEYPTLDLILGITVMELVFFILSVGFLRKLLPEKELLALGITFLISRYAWRNISGDSYPTSRGKGVSFIAGFS